MGMNERYFRENHKGLLQEALVIAEEMTSDFFKLSTTHWLRARYDILTLEDLHREEITRDALALVARYQVYPSGRSLKSASFDFYRVCLQDHNILQYMESRADLEPLPFLSYILTHELVHIVRFSQFSVSFEASAAERAREEIRVDALTRQILAPLNFLQLPPLNNFPDQFFAGGVGYAHL